MSCVGLVERKTMAFSSVARRVGRPNNLQLILLLHSRSSLSQPSSFHQTLSPPFHRTLGVHFSTFQHRYHDFLGAIRQVSLLPTEADAISALDDSGLKATPDVVRSAIWALKEDSRLAFLAFRWGERLGCCDEEAWTSMICVLCNHGKFNTAWCLIRDLHGSSLNTRRAMLVMIDRYAHANHPGKALWTFQVMEKFNLRPDREAFYFTLNALCKHGYIEEAEEFMFKSKKLFPLETEGFNIILNGWSNISVDVFEAKRVWREISKRCLLPDATTYTHLISCLSKVGHLFDSLRLYDGMKRKGWPPGIEVYNSLASVLARENCYKEALKILEKMRESGLKPDSSTYNGIISPLCKARKLDEARDMLTAMIEENISPTIETYHAFLESSGFEETLQLLIRMKKVSLGPTKETFHMVLDKFFMSKQPENAIKIWAAMASYEIVPDSSHYTIMVQGLATNGLLIKAREILAAMKSDGFVVDPKFTILLREPVNRKTGPKERQVRARKVQKTVKRRRIRKGK